MLLKRLLILAGGSFLLASGAWADDVGFVDCVSHSEEVQVFAKARKSPDMVASIPCGERFTILVYGFIFTRIQTRDGKVGYVYSNVISVDRSGAAVLQPASERVPVPRSSVPHNTAADAQPVLPAPVQPAAAKPASVETSNASMMASTAPVTASGVTEKHAEVSSTTAVQPETVAASPISAAQPQPAVAQPKPIEARHGVEVSVLPTPPTTASEISVAAPAAAAPATASATSMPEAASAPVVPPTPPEASQPQPAPVEVVAPPVRDASLRSTWERPIPGARRRTPVVELFGGYSFARLDGGGPGSNMNGALGSFAWNFKPWLQIVADTSYNVVTVSGTKNVLYGNHYGPRYFHRRPNRWGATPFVEALFGGSRADTSNSSGYKASDPGFSMKLGGGLDIRPSRHLEVRVFDFDYYRTSFGTNLHQNNYWVSTGIVLRLFGGADAE